MEQRINGIVVQQISTESLHPHSSALLIPMSQQDAEALHEDIEKRGITHALHVTADGRILDGVHRWQSAQKLGLATVPAQVLHFETEAEEHLYALYSNLKRRHMNDGQKAGVGLLALPYEEDLAKERKAKAAQEQAEIRERDEQGQFTDGSSRLLAVASNLDEKKKPASKKKSSQEKKQGQAATKAAQVVGVSPETIYKAKKVQESSPDLFASMLQGEVSVTKAYTQVRSEEKQQEVQEALESGRQLTDLEIMATLGIPVQPYDVWSFPTCDDRFGHDYPGRVPGQLVAHCLYFWTEQGDTVLDPMAGSGTTIDVCKALNRRVLAYDAHPCRDDITLHNLATQGWPDGTDSARLIFWDPPYFKKVDKGYGQHSISRYERAEYLAFFEQMARTIPETFQGRLAFLMSDYDEDLEESIWFTDYVNIFTAHQWKVARYIQTPLTTQSVHPDIVKKFREAKRLARLGRVLVVMSR